MHNVSKAYAGIPALRAANLAVAPGEIHALMGENGAGKSTLIKILAGVVTPDEAEIAVDDKPAEIGDPNDAFALGLRFIHQELNIVPTLSVAENISLGRSYPRRGGLFVDWRQLAERARAALGELGITHIDPRRRMGRLSIADQMLVRISSAFIGEDGSPARLYVMDEPTAALTREESERLFRVLREIRNSGRSVLYVSHRLDEVMALCDRATVLRDGETVDTGQMADITHDDLVSLMIGRRVEEAYPRRLALPREETALEFSDLTAAGLKGVSFGVRKGEIVGIAGLSGAGQTEMLKALFGAQKARATEIRVADRERHPASPAAAWASGFGYVPRERRVEGLIPTRSVSDNVTLPHLDRLSVGRTFLAPRRERETTRAQGAAVKLKAAGPRQLCKELSGGNQQKVVFAKALARDPAVLLLDEPTRGVDIGAKFDIYSIIREMTGRGMAVLLASSDLPELLGMCDRIIVMREGEISTVLEAEGLDEETLINHCYGRAVPAAADTHQTDH